VLGGNTACAYAGGTTDQRLASGSLLSTQTLPPTPLDNAGSTYQGSASARASYDFLGVAVSGRQVGASGGTSATDSAAAAFFEDTLSARSPFVTPAAAGFVRYVFSLDGSLSTAGTASDTASVNLSVRQATGLVFGLGRLSVQRSDPALFTALDGSPSTWTLGSGEASGSGDFGSTIHVPFFGGVDLPIVWGTPWDLQVGLLALSQHTGQASFLSSARLTDIQLFDAAHRRTTDFTLTSASGTDYLAASPVPEPATWMLLGLGLMAMRVAQGRRGTAVWRRWQDTGLEAIRCVSAMARLPTP
jgi:PEP-CTERM motif